MEFRILEITDNIKEIIDIDKMLPASCQGILGIEVRSDDEEIKEIKDNARVTAIVEPTKLNSMGTGANEGGPVATTSVNTLPTSTKGIIE